MKIQVGEYTLICPLTTVQIEQRLNTEIPCTVVKTKETVRGVVTSVVVRTVRLNTGKTFDIEASLPLPVVGDPISASVMEGEFCVSWAYIPMELMVDGNKEELKNDAN